MQEKGQGVSYQESASKYIRSAEHQNHPFKEYFRNISIGQITHGRWRRRS